MGLPSFPPACRVLFLQDLNCRLQLCWSSDFPAPLAVGAADRDALVSTAASGSGRLAARPARNSVVVPFSLAPRLLESESSVAFPLWRGGSAGAHCQFQGVAWPLLSLFCRRVYV